MCSPIFVSITMNVVKREKRSIYFSTTDTVVTVYFKRLFLQPFAS